MDNLFFLWGWRFLVPEFFSGISENKRMGGTSSGGGGKRFPVWPTVGPTNGVLFHAREQVFFNRGEKHGGAPNLGGPAVPPQNFLFHGKYSTVRENFKRGSSKPGYRAAGLAGFVNFSAARGEACGGEFPL